MRVPSVQGLLIALHTRPPSVRPTVRPRLGGGRLTGRGDRIRQKLFPVRTHVHRPRRKPQRRGLNRAPHSRAIHTSSIYPSFSISLFSLLPYKPLVGPHLESTNYHAIFSPFYFSFWSGPRTGHFLPSFPARLPLLPSLLCETNLPFPRGGRENQRDNFVGQTERRGKGWRGVLTTAARSRRRKGGWHWHLDSRNWG